MTGAHSQTFKAARVTVASDRSRQVVSERNTFPRMTSLCRGGVGEDKGSVLNQNLDCFLSTQVFCENILSSPAGLSRISN